MLSLLKGIKQFQNTLRPEMPALKLFRRQSEVPFDSTRINLIHKNGLAEYEITDVEKCQGSSLKSFFSRFKSINARRCCGQFCEISLIALIFTIPNLCAAAMIYVYVIGSVDPLSSIAAALRVTRSSWLVYIIFLPLIDIVAGLGNLMLLLGGVRAISKSFILSCIAVLVAFAPIWSPYVIEAAIRKHKWGTECDGFDGTIFMDAVNYGQSGLSWVQFPASLGGAKYQIYQSNTGIYEFAPVGGDSIVTYNFINETYTIHNTTAPEEGQLTANSQPLEFPELGLHSEGSWIRSCFAPAVSLQNATGDVVVQTGLTAYTDCSKLQVCAMETTPQDILLVAIGRILIALEDGAHCCTQSRWG